MGIELKTETIIDALREAPAFLGRGRNGKPPRKNFVLQAITRGINGHSLEALRVGSRWITSVEALRRRAEGQTRDAATAPTPAPAPGRRRAAEAAGRELDRLGI